MAAQDTAACRPAPAAIGIDFGTSKCCVAAVRGGRVHVLENEFGQRTTPSCVAFTSQQRLVGGAALDQAVVNCANTVHAVKRTLGRTYAQAKAIPSACKIERDGSSSDAILYCVDYRKRQLQLSPEQITAMLLTKMKDIAESSLGCPVKQAVISVPASFGNAQRAALLTAARVAGLEVLQLINETTAAGVAFEQNRTVKTAVTIAVVDFGAGKLDVSLMEVKEGSVRVIGAAGSPYHGSCGLDEVLVNYCYNLLRLKHGNGLEISDKSRVKLRQECERVKKTLSSHPEDELSFQSLDGEICLNISVSREEFNEMVEDDIRREIVGTFERLFKQKSMAKDTIDEVVLVGGSTRIPAVKSILEEYFGGHKLDQTVKQDEAVAQGAALRAAALTGAAAGAQVADVASYGIYCGPFKNIGDCVFSKFGPLSSSSRYNTNGKTKLYLFERLYDIWGSSCDTFLGSFTSGELRGHPVYLSMHLDKNGMFSFPLFEQGNLYRPRIARARFLSSSVISSWVKAEQKFQKGADGFELESLYSEVPNVPSSLVLDVCSSRELETCRNSASNTLRKNRDVEHVSMDESSPKKIQLNNVKNDSKQLLDTVLKKALAAKEEAARKQTELEKLADQISGLESLLSEVIHSVNDSDLERYSDSQEFGSCKATLSSHVTWAKNIESVSLTQISQKLEELTHVKNKVQQLKADAARVKFLVEEKAAVKLAEMEMLTDKIVDFKSLLSEVNCVLNDSDLQKYSDSQKFESCKEALSSFVTWKESSSSWKSASLAQVSNKLEELTRLENEVDQLKADAEVVERRQMHQSRTVALSSTGRMIKEPKDDIQCSAISHNAHLFEGTQTGTSAAQASPQADLVSESCQTGENKTSGSDGVKTQSQIDILRKYYGDSPILLPYLMIMLATSTDGVTVELCGLIHEIYSEHHCAACNEVKKFTVDLQKS